MVNTVCHICHTSIDICLSIATSSCCLPVVVLFPLSRGDVAAQNRVTGVIRPKINARLSLRSIVWCDRSAKRSDKFSTLWRSPS